MKPKNIKVAEKWKKIIDNEINVWEKSWFLKYSLLLSTYSAEQYTRKLADFAGKSITHTIIICQDGMATGYVTKKESNEFSVFLKKIILRNPKIIGTWIKKLYKSRNALISIIKILERKISSGKISMSDYGKFLNAFFDYGNAHFVIKRVPDDLEIEYGKNLFSMLVAARKEDESLYPRAEEFISKFITLISCKTSYKRGNLLCLTSKELRIFLEKNYLPPENILVKKKQASAIIAKNGNYEVFSGKKLVRELEDIILAIQNNHLIEGTPAYPGVVVGMARIIKNPGKADNFKNGDILVAPMTRIEYLELARKSSAIITDIGGMLSHAAIISREFKIPCIIGTKIATKVLKDGDLVEVDANRGVVRILKRK